MAGAIKQIKTKGIAAFGDFQTPPALALAATQILRRLGIRPRSILEPTCGRGAFVSAAAVSFPEADSIIGIDINRRHLLAAQSYGLPDRRIEFIRGDFFKLDWELIVTKAEGPWLIVGNPPWVASADWALLRAAICRRSPTFTGGEASKPSPEKATSTSPRG